MKKLILISLIILISATSVYALSSGFNTKQINSTIYQTTQPIEASASNLPKPAMMILFGSTLIGFASVQKRIVIK